MNNVKISCDATLDEAECVVAANEAKDNKEDSRCCQSSAARSECQHRVENIARNHLLCGHCLRIQQLRQNTM